MKFLDHLEEWMISILMAGATLLIFLSVLHRYGTGMRIPVVQDWLLSLNFSWAQELCIIMFVWMAKFGAAGVHAGVDVLVNRLPVEWRNKTIYVALLCGILFTSVIGTLGLTFVWENGMHYAVFNLLGLSTGDVPEGPTTPDLEWPTWVVYSAVWSGSYLMCFRFLQVLWRFARHGELPQHDHAHVQGLDEDDDEDERIVAAGVQHSPVLAQGGVK
jgi:C4-dicarboxylate transporter, DctQ subunit